MKKIWMLMVAAIMVMMAFSGCGSSTADTVIKGTIYTADKEDSVVEAVAVKDGKFT